jgi:N-acetyl-alpha-D-muramate 1-phosphate uridylyltransferase
LRAPNTTQSQCAASAQAITASSSTYFAGIARGEKARLAAQLASPIAEGRVTGDHFHGVWNDVGTPQRLAEMDQRLRRSQMR